MLHRGEVFLNKLKEARGKVAKLGSSFIVDGSVSEQFATFILQNI